MKTRQRLHADLSALLPDKTVPPFPAITVLLCGYIDDLEKRISDAHAKLHHLTSRESQE